MTGSEEVPHQDRAIILDVGANTHVLPISDDGSVGPIEIGFPVNFFGKFFTALHVNTNGSVTFREPLYAYRPFGLTSVTAPIIAPFLADVDTRSGGSGRIRHGTLGFEGRMAFCVSWIAVGYHRERSDKLNSFQLLLVDRNDTGLGNFDIVMNYDRVAWESGASTGGSGGLGGQSAGAGFSAGTGDPELYFEFPGSRVSGALLDTHAETGLTRTRRNSQVLGRHIFRMRRGRLDIPRPAGRSPKFMPRLVKLTNGHVLALGDSIPVVDVFNPDRDTWRAVGDSTARRLYHTATRLTDGTVLVTGGEHQPRSSELFDPASSTWTTRPELDMRVGRTRHTATLLKNGKVLVTGGEDAASVRTASAELYTPKQRLPWTDTGAMGTPRSSHTATLLGNGKVLVAGGRATADTWLSSAELYDPEKETWEPTGDMTVPRYEHTATLLQDGRVLVAGGGLPDEPRGSTELYDPGTGKWTPAGDMARPRRLHAAVMLGSGQVIVAGGYHEHSGILQTVELYDTAMGTWSNTTSMHVDRKHPDAILLDDGRVLIVGGLSNLGMGTYELYYPSRS